MMKKRINKSFSQTENRLKRIEAEHTPIGSVRAFLTEIEKLESDGEIYYRGYGYLGFNA